jgi:hypothetical protein
MEISGCHKQEIAALIFGPFGPEMIDLLLNYLPALMSLRQNF